MPWRQCDIPLMCNTHGILDLIIESINLGKSWWKSASVIELSINLRLSDIIVNFASTLWFLGKGVFTYSVLLFPHKVRNLQVHQQHRQGYRPFDLLCRLQNGCFFHKRWINIKPALVHLVRVRGRKLYLTSDSVNSTALALTWDEC